MYRLLFVVNEAAFFLSHRLPLAQAARQKGYEIHVATPKSTAVKRIRQEGFSYHSIPLNRQGRNPWKEIEGMMALYFLYRRLRPDLVHHVTLKPVLYGGIAARLACVPAVVNALTGLGFVFTAQGMGAETLRYFLNKIFRLAMGHCNSYVLFQNPDDRLLFIEAGTVPKEKTILIKGSGVDIQTYSPQPEPVVDVPVVVLASRMLWDKGVGEFVEAARILQTAGVKARFVLVGDTDPGNPAAVPQSMLKEWRDQGTVEWWGYCDNMPAILAGANIICLPSYREGLPKVLIEAAACGRPIVTTDMPGCREIVRHGKNGLLVSVRDSKELAQALRTLIKDSEMRQRMGQEGRALVVAEHSVDLINMQTINLYEKLLPKSLR
ncbi:glycosyltransferase family 4 protein [Nitrosococcus watsonii]|uniref:Glycosyl transferase group 1 n=1 Tax=Nitrosococcus watsoni (strain C-113) TaxID=105559 RepID=D8KB79_NITWC|nr:glycosyltransferase family 4 protein [Nitrosococcus watsonii]ADJ27613.1 glycosyl transferase group 1 [Nitrosococcus watsonii C-113]